MKFSDDQIRRMLAEAFDCGYSNSRELQEELIGEIIAKYEKEKCDKAFDGTSRIYKAEELARMPEGAEFVHSILGNCTVSSEQGVKFIQFANAGLTPAAFQDDGYPWDSPMSRIK